MKNQNTNVKTTGRRIKTEGYSYAISEARTQLRQKEADLRQGEYDRLAHGEKISRAFSRRGNSARELDRLGKPPQ